MILALHAITGAVVASRTDSMVAATVLGLVSHYFLDTISHTDYDIGKIENGEIKISNTAPLKIAADLIIGALIIFYALHTGRLHYFASTIIGAFFGILPDGLTFLDFNIKNKDRNIFTKFLKGHRIMHDKIHLEIELPIVKYFCQTIVILILAYLIFK